MEPRTAKDFAFLAEQGIDPSAFDLHGEPPKTVAYLSQAQPDWVPLFTTFLASVAERHPSRGFLETWALVRRFENRNPAHLKGISGAGDIRQAIGEITSAQNIKNMLAQREQPYGFAAYRKAVDSLDVEVLPIFRDMSRSLKTFLKTDESAHRAIMTAGQDPAVLARTQQKQLATLVLATGSLRRMLDAMSALTDQSAFTTLEGKEFFARFSAELAAADQETTELEAALQAAVDAQRASRDHARTGQGRWDEIDAVAGGWTAASLTRFNTAALAFRRATVACAIWAREKANHIHRADEIGFFDHQTAGVVLHLADTVADLALTAGTTMKFLGPVALGFAGLKSLKSGVETIWRISKDWEVTEAYIVENVPRDTRVSFSGANEHRTARDVADETFGHLETASSAFGAEGAVHGLGAGFEALSTHIPGDPVDTALSGIGQALENLPDSSHLAHIPVVSEAMAAPKAVKQLSRMVYEKVDVITDPAAVAEARATVERCLGPLVQDSLDSLCSTVEVLVHGENTMKVAFRDLITGERRVGWLDNFMNFQDEKDQFGPMSLWVRFTAQQADRGNTLNWKFPRDAEICWDRLMFIDAHTEGTAMTFVYSGDVTYGRPGGGPAPDTRVTIEFDSGNHEYIAVEVQDRLTDDRVDLLRLAAMELQALSMQPENSGQALLTELPDRSFHLDDGQPPLKDGGPAEVQGLEWESFLMALGHWNDWVAQGLVRSDS
ncbi:hypothetical protein ACIQWR_37785 [Streptomyces sp. NPDC098789]|uniref:hypothetical protein n=1 Tax=Streptomyces sp. NPDC098789 TaxID=3366098 RepID=UPI003810FDFA